MTRQEAHDLIDDLFNLRAEQGQENAATIVGDILDPANDSEADGLVERVLSEGKRVVRTSTSGDRVYELDDVKMTRAWVTNETILNSLGWEQTDVVSIEEDELLKYQMAPAIYRTADEI